MNEHDQGWRAITDAERVEYEREDCFAFARGIVVGCAIGGAMWAVAGFVAWIAHGWMR